MLKSICIIYFQASDKNFYGEFSQTMVYIMIYCEHMQTHYTTHTQHTHTHIHTHTHTHTHTHHTHTHTHTTHTHTHVYTVIPSFIILSM